MINNHCMGDAAVRGLRYEILLKKFDFLNLTTIFVVV